jgi:hypothetical protein
MLDLLDLLLLRRGIPSDDRALTFRRIDGQPTSKVIYFLPWQTPFYVARHAGFIPLEFLACYEMPPAIVSSTPELSVEALHRLVHDAQALLADRGVRKGDAIIVGLSVGTYPATFLANRVGARLCAVAAADRADLMLWQSPAARLVKRRCMQRGLELSHCSKVMSGYHPVQNLAGIHPNSMFIMGDRDPFIPSRRSTGLLRAIQRHAPQASVVKFEAGHVMTMMMSACCQLAMLGLEPARPRWLKAPLMFAQLRLAAPTDSQ